MDWRSVVACPFLGRLGARHAVKRPQYGGDDMERDLLVVRVERQYDAGLAEYGAAEYGAAATYTATIYDGEPGKDNWIWHGGGYRTERSALSAASFQFADMVD